MKIEPSLEEKIEALLQKGLSKKEIRKRLLGQEDTRQLDFFLNNLAYPEDRRRYQIINFSLVLILGFVTIKKFFFALSFGSISLTTLLALVVPTVNVYLIREIISFRRVGYQFLAVLSALSMLNAENRAFPEVILVPAMTMISAFLYLKLFYLKDRSH